MNLRPLPLPQGERGLEQGRRRVESRKRPVVKRRIVVFFSFSSSSSSSALFQCRADSCPSESTSWFSQPQVCGRSLAGALGLPWRCCSATFPSVSQAPLTSAGCGRHRHAPESRILAASRWKHYGRNHETTPCDLLMLVDRTVDTRGGWANCLTGGSQWLLKLNSRAAFSQEKKKK